MIQFYSSPSVALSKTTKLYLRAFVSGLLLPLGFAPFHFPGLAILSLALLFLQLTQQSPKKAFFLAFIFGLGFLGLGTSWIFNSIHIYGNFNMPSSALFTLLFVATLSLYPAFLGLIFSILKPKNARYTTPFLFSSLWVLSEYLRAQLFTGFPWLLVGFGQIDTPLQHLLPLIGVFGVSGITTLASAFLGLS